MPTQNVNLTTELERFVKAQVASGRFQSVSEVHRAALSEMFRQEEERHLRLNHLRHEIAKGVDDMEAGRFQIFESESTLGAFMDGLLDEAETGSGTESR